VSNGNNDDVAKQNEAVSAMQQRSEKNYVDMPYYIIDNETYTV